MLIFPSQFRGYMRRPAVERWLLLRSALWLVAARVAVWVVPFGNLIRWVEGMHQRQASTSDLSWAVRIGWAVDVASRHVLGTSTCLPRALAAAVLLKRAGLPAQVRVGVARGEDGSPEAHAWVECGGQVVIGGSELERYTLITALKGAGE